MDRKYNGKRFKLDGTPYIVTATIVSYHPDNGSMYPAVIYKNELTNKMYCVSMERIKQLIEA